MPFSSESLQAWLQYSSVCISAVSSQLHRSWEHSMVCCMALTFPRYGEFSTSPPAICAAALETGVQPGTAFHG